MNLNIRKYSTETSGQNLLILHGLFGMLDNWHSLAIQFSKYYTVYSIDLRNHGKSPNSDEFSYPILAQDIYDFLNQQAIEKSHLLGHSMGGKAVMEFSFNHPEYIDKLIVADISPRAYPPHHDEVFDAIKSIDLKTITRRGDAEKILLDNKLDMGTTQFILKNLSNDGQGYHWKFNFDSLFKNYPLITGGVDPNGYYGGQTLFLKGANSRYINIEKDEELINRQFPMNEIIEIPNAGHWLHADQPQLFFEAVVDWVR